ncbi:MAG: hypothetical protein RRY69_04655 [Oscillospiraceae bacterium]
MMKRLLSAMAAIVVVLCISQTAFAATAVKPTPTGNEISPDGHTDVIIWITDGKNLPNVNALNPVLTVQVRDERGNLIPNATVTLHLVNPNLSGEIVVKSSAKNRVTPVSTTPNSGAAPIGDEITYEVFGPNNPLIQYEIRATAPGFSGAVSNPFQINFTSTGTVQIVLKNRVADDFEITYSVRNGDQASLAFSKTDIKRGSEIGAGNIPRLILPQTPNKWKLDGYYINGVKYTAAELAVYKPTANTQVEIRTFPDDNDDNNDDRGGRARYNVDFQMRAGDLGTLNFTRATVNGGDALTAANVPTVSGLPTGWKLVGYSVNGRLYSAADLALMVINGNMIDEVRTMPDVNNNGIDDRTETAPPPAKVPKTGAEDGYKIYIIGFSVSLFLLLITFILLFCKKSRNDKESKVNKK